MANKWIAPFLSPEFFVVQGVPVLLSKIHPMAKLFPTKLAQKVMLKLAFGLGGRISDREFRLMAGNGMHTSSVGSAFQMTVGGLRCRQHAETAAASRPPLA